jgi:hypothetical protein
MGNSRVIEATGRNTDGIAVAIMRMANEETVEKQNQPHRKALAESLMKEKQSPHPRKPQHCLSK